MLPEEVDHLKEKMELLSSRLEETLDLETIFEIAGEAEELPEPETAQAGTAGGRSADRAGQGRGPSAFSMRIISVSSGSRERNWWSFLPCRDRELPEGISGLLLHGG